MKFYIRSNSKDGKVDADSILIEEYLQTANIAIKNDNGGVYIETDKDSFLHSRFSISVSKDGNNKTLQYTRATGDSVVLDPVKLMHNVTKNHVTSFEVFHVGVSFLRYDKNRDNNFWQDIATEVKSYKPNTSIFSAFGFSRKFNSSDKIAACNKFYAYAQALALDPEKPQISLKDQFEDKDIAALNHHNLRKHVERALQRQAAYFPQPYNNSLLDVCLKYMAEIVTVEENVSQLTRNSG